MDIKKKKKRCLIEHLVTGILALVLATVSLFIKVELDIPLMIVALWLMTLCLSLGQQVTDITLYEIEYHSIAALKNLDARLSKLEEKDGE